MDIAEIAAQNGLGTGHPVLKNPGIIKRREKGKTTLRGSVL